MDEIKSALQRARNSALVPDGIGYEDISKLSAEGLGGLAVIYNNSIESPTVD